MQHGEEVGAAQELGAGRLEQQGETRAAAGVRDAAFPSVICNRNNMQSEPETLMKPTRGAPAMKTHCNTMCCIYRQSTVLHVKNKCCYCHISAYKITVSWLTVVLLRMTHL